LFCIAPVEQGRLNLSIYEPKLFLVMMKLYLYALTVSALMFASPVKSQCPAGLAFPFIYGNNNCYVFVTNGLPNANINVYDGLDKINTTEGSTDADGMGSVFYDCSRNITRILLTLSDGTVCEIGPGSIAAPANLPIKLGKFSVSVKGSAAVIEWTSLLELSSSKYVIERSFDGNNYTAIGEVAAAGDSYTTLRYSYTDAELGNQAAFYRLQMVDIDGKFEYSKVVPVDNTKSGTGSLRVGPNPFSSDVQLLGIPATDVNRNNIRLYNITGQPVNFTISSANTITIDAGVPAGIYILRVKDKTFRLMKEK
jgi:hypothetical protein